MRLHNNEVVAIQVNVVAKMVRLINKIARNYFRAISYLNTNQNIYQSSFTIATA